MNLVRILLAASACAAAMAGPARAAIIDHYPGGSGYANWPNFELAVPGLSSGVIPATPYPHLDFVGDADDAVMYHASDSEYVYFRVRVHFAGTVQAGSGGTFHDTVWLYFDISGWGNENGLPDYSVAWDSKGGVNGHGLELLLPVAPLPATWGEMTTEDVDGQAGQKISPPDFNYAGDGYLRTVDGVATESFGVTTFVDFAIRWSYLSQTYEGDPLTNLAPGQTWRVAVASVHDQTDHASPNVDVAGASLSDQPALRGWSNTFVAGEPDVELPENATGGAVGLGMMLLLAAGGGFRLRRRA